MSNFSMDMSKEKEPNQLFDEGWHQFEIISIEEDISKGGNEMFRIFLALSSNASKTLEIYATAIPGKRWFLKMFLNACGVKPSEDGFYNWDSEDIIGKNIECLIENQEEPWIDRDGRERKTPKSKITRFK